MPHHHDDMTFHGLCDQTKHLIEKFGFMVIRHHHHGAEHRGSMLCYAGALYRHVKALEHALGDFRETSSKHRDIKIMHHKLQTLWKAALEHFRLEAREVLEDLGEEVVEAAEKIAEAVRESPEYDRLRTALFSGSRRESSLGRMSGTSDGVGASGSRSPSRESSRSRSPSRLATAAALASTAAVRSGSRPSGSSLSDRISSGSRVTNGSQSSEDEDIATILNSARNGSPSRASPRSMSGMLPSRVASRASDSMLS